MYKLLLVALLSLSFLGIGGCSTNASLSPKPTYDGSLVDSRRKALYGFWQRNGGAIEMWAAEQSGVPTKSQVINSWIVDKGDVAILHISLTCEKGVMEIYLTVLYYNGIWNLGSMAVGLIKPAPADSEVGNTYERL